MDNLLGLDFKRPRNLSGNDAMLSTKFQPKARERDGTLKLKVPGADEPQKLSRAAT